MKSITLLACAILTLGVCGPLALTQQPQPAPACSPASDCSFPLLKGCPDDYCRKPLPATHCLPCGEPDDYCRKPWPKIWQLCGLCGPDDYDRKPCPPTCRPLDTTYYSCGKPCWTGAVQPARQEPPAPAKLYEGKTKDANRPSPYQPR